MKGVIGLVLVSGGVVVAGMVVLGKLTIPGQTGATVYHGNGTPTQKDVTPPLPNGRTTGGKPA